MIIKGMKSLINVNLKNLRKISGFTQENLSEKMNVSRQTIAKWESGETVPDITNCMVLAALYGISLDDLVNYSEEKEGSAIQPHGKHIFGTVTVGERGQIVIPKKARTIFDVKPGDMLLVLGDEAQGIGLVKPEALIGFVKGVSNAKECKEDE